MNRLGRDDSFDAVGELLRILSDDLLRSVLIAVHEGTLTDEDIAARLGVEIEVIEAALAELVEAGLLLQSGGEYALKDIVAVEPAGEDLVSVDAITSDGAWVQVKRRRIIALG